MLLKKIMAHLKKHKLFIMNGEEKAGWREA